VTAQLMMVGFMSVMRERPGNHPEEAIQEDFIEYRLRRRVY
jgi:hypothetical protein